VVVASATRSSRPRGADEPKGPAAGTSGGGFALAIAVGASSALSFGFHAVASRLLDPGDYGGLAALLALMAAAAVPITAVQAAITRSVAHDLARGARPSGLGLLRRTVGGALAMFGLAAAASPLVSHAVRLPALPAILMGAWLAASVPEAVMKGLLVGSGRLRPVAAAILSGALLRVVALMAMRGWAGPGAAMAATVVAELVIVAVLAGSARRAGLLTADGHRTNPGLGDAGRALNCQLALWLYAAMATVVARRSLGTADVGSFAAMATAGGACIFLPQAVATAAFPRFVADRRAGLLLAAVGLAAGVSLACGAVMCARPSLLFAVLFGRGYRPDAVTLALLVVHFAALGCLTVIAQHLVACRRRGAWALWAGLASAAALAAGLGHSPRALAAMLGVPSTTLTLVFVAGAVRAWARQRHDGQPVTPLAAVNPAAEPTPTPTPTPAAVEHPFPAAPVGSASTPAPDPPAGPASPVEPVPASEPVAEEAPIPATPVPAAPVGHATTLVRRVGERVERLARRPHDHTYTEPSEALSPFHPVRPATVTTIGP
jgi:O-antigen/teichoic acid export membrane protein